MYEEISSSRNRSLVLVAFFFFFIVLLGYVFAQVTMLGTPGLIAAVAIAALLTSVQYYKGDQIVLGISHAREVDKKEYPHLYNTVEGLAIAAGVPTPKMYVIDDSAPNAFATGRDPEHASIAVTTGLLDKLNRQELEGVIGHEMSHIRNYDIRLMMLTVVMVGIIALLSDWMLRSFLWGGGRRDKRENGAGAALVVIGLALAILSPLIAQLVKLAVSRQREYLADASSAQLTRYPQGLANALKKISKDKEPLEAANKATAHLYIVNPLKDLTGTIDLMFSTHPPIEDRIKRLEEM